MSESRSSLDRLSFSSSFPSSSSFLSRLEDSSVATWQCESIQLRLRSLKIRIDTYKSASSPVAPRESSLFALQWHFLGSPPLDTLLSVTHSRFMGPKRPFECNAMYSGRWPLGNSWDRKELKRVSISFIRVRVSTSRHSWVLTTLSGRC